MSAVTLLGVSGADPHGLSRRPGTSNSEVMAPTGRVVYEESVAGTLTANLAAEEDRRTRARRR